MSPLLPDVIDAEVARLLAALPFIRPLRTGDRALVEALMRDLSPALRFRRFHGAVTELPAALLDRLARADIPGEAAFLATTMVRGREVAVGEARYAISSERHDAREFAIVVSEPWQRMGVGIRLLRKLIRYAARSGVGTLYGDTFADNIPMLALARRLGLESRRHPTDPRLLRMSVRLDGLDRTAYGAGTRRAAGSLPS
jgi:acetyltransferase